MDKDLACGGGGGGGGRVLGYTRIGSSETTSSDLSSSWLSTIRRANWYSQLDLDSLKAG